jgi:subtilisin family serine protease
MTGKAQHSFGHWAALTLLVSVAGLCPDARCQSNADAAAPLADGRLIVRFAPETGATRKRAVRAASGASDVTPLPLIDAEIWTLAAGDPRSAAARLSQQPDVLYAEPNYRWQADRIPNDPQFSSQWGLHNTGQTQGSPDADIDAPEGWDISTGRPILIGIIDSGIDTTHVDLAENLWSNPGEIPGNGVDDDGNGYTDDLRGWDFVDGDNSPYDLHGHGTHVAGIAAACGNNGTGITGVHWSARIVPLRFLDADGFGSSTAAIQAIAYAVRMGIKITCNSWGGAPFSQALRDAIAAACDSGMLFVAAAGNDGKNTDVTPHYPASYDLDGILSVAATDDADRLANELLWRSNYGPRTVDLAAPGVDVQSCWPGSQYKRLSGTSMATPHVAGAAAVLWSEHPNLTALQVKSRLMTRSDPLPDLLQTTRSGGRLNLRSALADPDTLAPPAITDLAASGVEGTRVQLEFTAPGDDGQPGAVQAYIVRYAEQPLEALDPDSLIELHYDRPPQPPGEREHLEVSALRYGAHYYFAVISEDGWFNSSAPSNQVEATTLGPPVLVMPGPTTDVALMAGADTSVGLVVANAGAGEMFFGAGLEYSFDRLSPAAAAAGPPDTLDLLLVYADQGALGLQGLLKQFDDVGRVELWYAGTGGGSIPRYRDLRGYDVVVAWNNKMWADPFEIGAVLAEFMDSGGAVVTCVDAWGAGSFTSLGRYFEQPGYSPFASTGEALFEVRTLGAFAAAHPIMKDVKYLAIASFHNQVRLTEGAGLVASWNDGTPLLATNPGTVAINIWPGDGYHWLGDFPPLIHNAVRFAAGLDSWLDVRPATGEVAPADSVTLELQVDARRLVEGPYQGFLLLSTSDPAAPLVEHRVNLDVRGSPRLTPVPPEVEFHDAYVGFPDTIYLPLHNAGTAGLTVHSLSFDVAFFDSPTDSLEIPPGGSDSLPIIFSPPAVGEVWCNLDFATDDPRVPVVRTVLHAQTELPPEAQLSAHLATADLYAGTVELDTVRLFNAGQGDLHFRTALRGSSSPLDRVARLSDVTSDSVPVLVWARYADLSPGNEFEALRSALAVSGASASLEITTTSDPAELAALLFDRQMFLVLEQENALPELQQIGLAFAPVLQEFAAGGGTVVFLMEWAGGSGFAAATGLLDARPVGRGSQVPLLKVDPGHALLEGVSDSLSGANLTAWYELRTPGCQTVVSDTSGQYAVVATAPHGAGRSVLLGFDFFSYNDDMIRLLRNTVNLARQNLAWLDVSPDSGWVAAGAAVELEVRFDAEPVTGGSYQGEVVLETNDPAVPRHRVQVQLAVTDAAHLDVPAALDLGSTYQNAVTERPLVIRNSGDLLLRVDSLSAPPDGYQWEASGFELAPKASREIAIRFAAQAPGVHALWQRIYSNDPAAPVDSVLLSAQVEIAPRMAFAPDTVRARVDAGGSTPAEWLLRNLGGSDLRVDMIPRYDEIGPLTGPVWAELPKLPEARSEAGVVALADGRVLVFGGYGENNSVLSSLVVFDPATGLWQSRAPMPTGDHGMAAARDLQGRAYSFAARTDYSYRYDPAADAWAPIADMPINRVWEASAALGADGLIYVTGGEGDGADGPLSDVQIYHPEGDYWTLAPGMSVARYGHATVATPDGRLYVIGGRDSYLGPPINSVEVCEPATGTWSARADCPQAASQFAACLGRDFRIYTMGGKSSYLHGTGPFSRDTWVYDPRLDSWTPGPSLPVAAGEWDAVAAGDFIRILGGSDSTVLAGQWGLHTPAWLGTLPSGVVVPAGDSLPVVTRLDGSGLPAGWHPASVVLVSNDPAAPVSETHIELVVSDAPDMWLLDSALEFAPCAVGVRDSLAVKVANVGTADLHITAVSSSPSVFVVEPVWTVAAGAESLHWVGFAPTVPGDVTGRLDLESDDPDRPLATLELAGSGKLPGSLSVAAPDLVLRPRPSTDTSVTLRLTNPGAGVLHWAIEGADAPLADPGGSSSNGREGGSLSTAAAASEQRRLSGLVIAASDARFVPAYTLVLGDLEDRGARVVYFARPLTAAWLDSIDVVLLDDYVVGLFEADLSLLRSWVMRGGRLLLQSKRTQGLLKSAVLLEQSGIRLSGQSYEERALSRFAGRAAAWDVDSIAIGPSALWCDWTGPAEALVKDEFGRGVVAASRLGFGRVAVTCSELLDNEYIVRADTRRFANLLIDWLALGTPLVSEPVSGSLNPGTSVDVRLGTASIPMASGTYVEPLAVVSDAPQNGRVELAATLFVTGQAEMEIAADTLFFDTAFVGYGTRAELEITNAGTAPLLVSQFRVLPEVFRAADTPLSVPVFGTARVPVAFDPIAPGTFEGTLTVRSNAGEKPTHAVVLRGTALLPPAIEAAPAPVAMTLAAGDSGRAWLSVGNSGASDLRLSVIVLPDTGGLPRKRTIALRAGGRAGPAALADTSGTVDKRNTPAAGAAAVLYRGDLIGFGVGDEGDVFPFQYPADTSQLWGSGTTVAYRAAQVDYVMTSYLFAGQIHGDSLVEEQSDTLHVEVRFYGHTEDDRLGIERRFSFEVRRKYVAVETRLVNRTSEPLEAVVFKHFCDWDLDGTPANDNWDYDTLRQMPYGWDRRYAGIASQERPSVLDLEGRNDYFRRTTLVNFQTGPVWRYDGLPILDFDLGDLAPGASATIHSVLAMGDSLSDLQREIDRGLQRVKWLEATVRSTVLQPGSRVDLELSFDATELFAGEYLARLLVVSNDPARPQAWWPVRLAVMGAPDLGLELDTADFGVVYLGYPATLNVNVANRGADSLCIFDVSTDQIAVTPDWTRLTLPPKQDTVLRLSLAARDTGRVEGRLVIVHNDTLRGPVDLPLRARAEWPPALAVSADTVKISLGSGTVAQVPLSLANGGRGTLHWAFAPQPRMTAVPDTGDLLPGAATLVTLHVSAVGLAPGRTVVVAVLSHNDPARPPVSVPLDLDVFAVQRGDVFTDNRLDTRDIIFLVNSLWRGGPDPVGTSGDLDCDDAVTLQDLIFLVNYIFKAGLPPACGD